MILIILFVKGVYAANIAISPVQINLEGKIGEEICGNVKITSETGGLVIGQDGWSKISSRNLNDFIIDSKSIGLDMNYPETFNLDGSRQFDFCVRANMSGTYYGALLCHLSGTYSGVGMWITVNITGDERISGAISLFGEPTEENNFVVIPLLVMQSLLLFITLLLMTKLV